MNVLQGSTRATVMMTNPLSVIAVVFLVCSTAFAAPPSSLSPRGTKLEQQVAKKNAPWWKTVATLMARKGVLHFADPVHEEITSMMFGCTDSCEDPDLAAEFATLAVIAGVRWNDDPPFRLEPGEAQHTSCKTA